MPARAARTSAPTRSPRPPGGSAPSSAALARQLVESLGGRFSTEAGIDVDRGRREVERWFLCATLFGTRISAATAVRTYRIMARAGVRTVADAGEETWDDLVALLDEGGYARYDFRTATRLLTLSHEIHTRFPRGIASAGQAARQPGELVALLDGLPGWGPVTTAAFLRELRGVWKAARPPLDGRAARAAEHLGLRSVTGVEGLERLAGRSALDPRDLEAALVRIALAHERAYSLCVRARARTPGAICTYLVKRESVNHRLAV